VAVGLAAVLLAGCGGAAAGEPAGGSSPSVSVAASDSGSGVGSGSSSGSSPGASAAAQAVPVPSAAAAVSISRAERPVKINIPSIGVESSLTTLDINADGSLQVPTSYQEAGWLDRSPAPGQQGPAVIAGHIDSKSGPGVFYRLTDLKPGAKIVVTRGNGTKVSFTVSGVEQYAKSKFPTAAVYGPAPGPELRLITCGGAFDRSTGHYVDNVVVFAA
jgi:sortase (surface protein transpeptidase)